MLEQQLGSPPGEELLATAAVDDGQRLARTEADDGGPECTAAAGGVGQQQSSKSVARKELLSPAKTVAGEEAALPVARRRVSTSLPNCLRPRSAVQQQQEQPAVKEQQLGQELLQTTALPKEQPKGAAQQQQQRMTAFLGTVRFKETAFEFLRGTIGRSRRKGADLAGTKETQRPMVGNTGGNGVCPVPETLTACTSDGGAAAKKTGLVSFSQAGATTKSPTGRKPLQSMDTCVADSFDEQMIDKICTMPRNMDRSEWLAAHVLALFEHVNGISCTLSEHCTPVTCSVMSYPGNQKAPWHDERGKRHYYSAMRYIDSVMSFCEASRTNQAIFPTKYGVPFSSDFEAHCSRMVRLLWHCLGHMFAKHWEHLGMLNLRPQFGLVLAHLARLAKLHGLLAEKELHQLTNTLHLARPSASVDAKQAQPRQLKRAMPDDGPPPNPNTVPGRIQQTQRKQPVNEQQAGKEDYPQQPAPAGMKSGSWGGHSALLASVVSQNCCAEGGPILTNNCQNCYAQTC